MKTKMKKAILIITALFTNMLPAQIKEGKDTIALPVIQQVVEDDNELYNGSDVEVKPEYPGGMESMNSFLKKNFILPKHLVEKKVSGKIYVTMVIEKDGSLTNLKILREIELDSGKELIRVINLMPKWNAGMQNGKKIRCKSYIVFQVE